MTYRKLFESALLFTTVFPNIRIFGSAHSFQPLTLPLIVVHVLITGRLQRLALYFGAAYLTCVLASLLHHGNVSTASLLYAILYLSGPITFFYFLERRERFSEGLINLGLFFTFLTTAEQFFVGSPAVAGLLSSIFANRPEEVSIGLRGVAGFMSEPSHSGRLYVCLLFLAFAATAKLRVFWLLMAIPFLLMNRSASAFLLLLVLVGTLSYKTSKGMTLASFVLGMLVFPYFLSLEFRFVEVFDRLGQAWALRADPNVVGTLGMAGGARLIQTTIGFLSIGLYPLGNGIGSAADSFTHVAQELGFALPGWVQYVGSTENLRPNSYVSQIVYDFGWLGMPVLGSLLLALRRFELAPDPLVRASFVLGLAQLFVASTTTVPWPWVMMAVGLTARPTERTPQDGLRSVHT